MNEINDGDAAFPLAGIHSNNYGMSLRDWFAGQALSNRFTEYNDSCDTAYLAYLLADAMLKARKPKEAPKESPKDMPAKLAEMLEQYRLGEREMPTYAELAALVQP